ncbi:PP2C family protein-serine/threonine phosphatase [Nocardioides sp. L-11A]|uniref:PP2C family protein-serine/threonine phosphatase n=1 Tax=Nocardioides sp. L-11A TaxID=3043848 RepID=UPI00249A05AA|nr:PP2C family protein-serine/threonine phosphatase [Nocardioides sp. L-11A]
MDDAATWARLRERLLSRGRMPELPDGWRHQSAMIPAEGYAYGGDFIVSDLDVAAGRLRTVLVDVCGSGETAVPAALQFAGALESLIRVVPADELLRDANAYLLAQPSGESIATAVQLDLDLATGSYLIRSAGHPPALVWSTATREWRIDNARGTALGVSATPEVHESTGVLAPGDALLFYTDGVVESRAVDIDTGISWLRQAARASYLAGWEGAADRIIDGVERGDDDRAVLVLARR